MAPCDAHELIAKLRAENERLRRAVEWIKEHSPAFADKSGIEWWLSDVTKQVSQVPAEFAEIICKKESP